MPLSAKKSLDRLALPRLVVGVQPPRASPTALEVSMTYSIRVPLIINESSSLFLNFPLKYYILLLYFNNTNEL
jgi:hypothetical protein